MNTTETYDLPLPRCCAHLMSGDNGPLTARTTTVAVSADFSAQARASESQTATEPTLLLPATQAAGA
ncbi:hypothetical protein [Streptomyces sp. NPDC057794]|uniref:hypothetical protein n=1 Tax=Streptomyces sp. NPDC057794 TaxID=3346251 RepID=UPI0036C2D6E6